MTRDELEAILIDCRVRKLNIADRILAALEKEREEEVVVGEAKATNSKEAFWCHAAPYSRVARPMMEIYEYREKEGIKDQLIFRPTKEAK